MSNFYSGRSRGIIAANIHIHITLVFKWLYGKVVNYISSLTDYFRSLPVKPVPKFSPLLASRHARQCWFNVGPQSAKCCGY